MASDYFQEADAFYENEEYDKALEGFQYILTNYPRNELYPKAFYNTGYIFFKQERFEKAASMFRSILIGSFNEKEKLGGGIMDEPFANYRHRAAVLLSEIHYREKRYDSALYFFSLADSVYPYLHFCGNEYAANDVYTALRYAEIYQKMEQPDMALSKLLPAVFITLADNAAVITELKKLLQKKESLKTILDQSLNHIYAKKIPNGKNTYMRYYFRFLNAEIPVPENYRSFGAPVKKEQLNSEIRQTDFYKMIVKLSENEKKTAGVGKQDQVKNKCINYFRICFSKKPILKDSIADQIDGDGSLIKVYDIQDNDMLKFNTLPRSGFIPLPFKNEDFSEIPYVLQKYLKYSDAGYYCNLKQTLGEYQVVILNISTRKLILYEIGFLENSTNDH